MFIFQVSPGTRTGSLVPASWTTEDVLKRFGSIYCPSAVAEVLAKLDNPAKKIPEIKQALQKLTRVAERQGGLVLQQLRDPTVAALLVSHPRVLVGIAEASQDGAEATLSELRSPWVAERMDAHPYAFLEIVKATGTRASQVFAQLAYNNVAGAFDRAPDTLVRIAQATRGGAPAVFSSFQREQSRQLLERYQSREIPFDRMMLHFYPQDAVAIELGRPLDDLHDAPAARKKYLDSLSTAQVLGLLLSNPEYFYTTTNHMLLDRLKSDLKGRPVTELLEEYHVGEAETRNLLFRSMNYDRFYGRDDALVNDNELQGLVNLSLAPLAAARLDPRYYFPLANSMENIVSVPSVRESALAKLSERLQQVRGSGTSVERALEFLIHQVNPVSPLLSEKTQADLDALKEKAVFQPENYMHDGKLTIVQVFDRYDTETDHWPMSQKWFEKYDKTPETGPDGERIYETENVRIILFMGGSEQENQRFVAKQLQQTPNLVLTFRGHSYSLPRNMPYGIFGNREGHVLFIPGSCGSAGSTPEYIVQNPNTDLRFFSNTSTGRGQVTNAVVDALIKTTGPTAFEEILRNAARAIARAGGDTATIKAWSAGESLLAYVQQK